MRTSPRLCSAGSGHILRFLSVFGAWILILALIGPLELAAPATAPQTASRHVAITGSDTSNNSLDPDLPCRTIQRAIAMSGSGDMILVAQGTYVENLLIPTTLKLRVGYEAQTWTRDLDLHPTIIDGSGSQPMPGDWDGRAVAKSSAIRDNTVSKMWFDVSNLVDDVAVGLASSANGTSWTKSAANPVLTGTSGSWDEFASERAPYVLKEGGVFKMWYESGEPRQLGYATSSDGMNWTRVGNGRVLAEERPLGDPMVAGLVRAISMRIRCSEIRTCVTST